MRRSTIGLLVTCACGLLWIPLMATAQLAEKVWRIGVLGAGVAPSAAERQQSSFWPSSRNERKIYGKRCGHNHYFMATARAIL